MAFTNICLVSGTSQHNYIGQKNALIIDLLRIKL